MSNDHPNGENFAKEQDNGIAVRRRTSNGFSVPSRFKFVVQMKFEIFFF